MDGKTGHCTGKLCGKCEAIQPYMRFDYKLGYVWGNGHPNEKLRGKPAHFGSKELDVIIEYTIIPDEKEKDQTK